MLKMDNNYLAHYGILGQKWGIRRFQNPDGSLTEAGKDRYGHFSNRIKKKRQKDFYNKVKGTKQYIDVYDNLRESDDLRNAIKKAKENPDFQKHINNAKKASYILSNFDNLPSKKANKYFDDERIMDYQGAFKLYLKDTKQYEQYQSSINSIKEVERFGKKIADDLLGRYGKKRIQYGSTMSEETVEAINDTLKMPDTYFDDLDEDYWFIKE